LQNNHKIFFLIRSLELGGAERQLTLLAKGLHEKGYQVVVAVFYAGGFYQQELEQAGVKVLDLQKQGRWEILAFLRRYIKSLKMIRPAVLYPYLGMPNILSLLARLFLPGVRIVWGVRASNMNLERYDWLERFAYKIECALSRFADLIIVNSHAGMEFAAANGFPRGKMCVIPNGIDLNQFQINAALGRKIRQDWGVGEEVTLIGRIGRMDPMKDYPTFLQAAALLKAKQDKVHFVCVGDGPGPYKQQIHELAAKLGLNDSLTWAGSRTDLAEIYNALDIFTSSSAFGEGFPNVVGEAMACGLPCVVTDVGDSARIVDALGKVVPAEDPQAMVDAWTAIISGEFALDATTIRSRIAEQFSIAALLQQSTEILGGVDGG
jgi:glycosyltransferase involved in cell wall biosynthesis